MQNMGFCEKYTRVVVVMGFTPRRCCGVKSSAYLSAMFDYLWSVGGPGTVFSCFDD